MTEEHARFSDESWNFALKFYGSSGVSEACLRLQSAAGVDVMFLLLIIFVATQKNITVTLDDIRALDDICRPWREQVVRPLRSVRVALKAEMPDFIKAEAELLRSRIKAEEIHAERIENDLVGDFFNFRPMASPKLTSSQISDCLVAVVRHFDIDALEKGASSDIDILAQAALKLSL